MTETASARDRLDIVDVLYRFALSIDTTDEALMASTLTDDAVLTFTEAAQKAGAAADRADGAATIAAAVTGLNRHLDTAHQITNPLVELQGPDSARLRALVEAQHFPAGTRDRHLMQKNRYDLTLIRIAGSWKIKTFELDNVYTTGDIAVMNEAIAAVGRKD